MHTQIPLHPDELTQLRRELESYWRLMRALHKIWPELAVALEQALVDEPETEHPPAERTRPLAPAVMDQG